MAVVRPFLFHEFTLRQGIIAAMARRRDIGMPLPMASPLPHSGDTKLTTAAQLREMNQAAAAIGAVERKIPSLKIRARKPPRPLRKSSAPGAIARSIQ
ncbi:MAG: hypothetical protein QOI07_2053 [Verrucomicrobiota bacterium]